MDLRRTGGERPAGEHAALTGRRPSIVLLLGLGLLLLRAVFGAASPPGANTLEDIYGDTGNTFQGAIGFVVFEGTPSSQAQQSYGLAIDDMVVKWREFELERDATDCSLSGACAVVELATTNFYEGQGVLSITVLDASPEAQNDCDLDGTYDGTNDCNSNGTVDVVVRATSAADVAGEIVLLEQGPSAVEYAGTVPVSTAGDGTGVLFVAPIGTEFPAVTVTYLDRDDGTGAPCPSDVNPANHGVVRAVTTLFPGEVCDVRVVAAEVEDNGDHDRYADTDETVAMRLQLLNNCGLDLHSCAARLFSRSPEVDCVIRSVIDVGDLEAGNDRVWTSEAFVWKVAAVQRTDIEEDLSAEFGVTIACDEIYATSTPQSVSLELDLTLDTHGQTPAAWVESFESGTLGKFRPENLDAGLPGNNNTEGLINSDGWRCQYSDPDYGGGATYGSDYDLDCFPCMNLDQSNAVFWQTDGIDTGSPDGGRAKTGSYSMYYGVYLASEVGFTTPMAVVESVRTTDPINLGFAPELSFWQQVSLMDGRYVNIDPSRNADRGVVQIKTVDAAGEDTSVWTRLEPFRNPYDTQNYDYYWNCMFDPVDDGNTEDDYFDPTDPNRRLGPSSTCHPMFTYSCLGDTDEPFAPRNVCNATAPPSAADAPDQGTGTWVESRVDLTEFRGKRVKLRFLASAIKATAETHDGQFDGVNPGPWDDGWWIDDVTVDETLTDPAELVVDLNELHGCAGDPTVGCLSEQDCIDAGTTGPCDQPAPACGPVCTIMTAVASTDPDRTGGPLDEVLAAPGRSIELNAAGSSGRCLDGALQFRFSTQSGAELRHWSENPILVDAPRADTDYLVEVRCSTDTSCGDSVVADVDVACPSSGNLGGVFPVIRAANKTTWTWTPPKDYLLWQGDLHLVSSYAGSVSPGSGASFTHVTEPPPGAGYYYLLREVGEYCNNQGAWSSGGPAESPLRQSALP